MGITEALISKMASSADDGSISVAEFMEICLYDPKNGYYTSKEPFGASGDFTTAPEISPLFGEAVAVWVVHTWESLGSPQKFNLIEGGPGRGTLMADIMRTLQKVAPACVEAINIILLEISPTLQKMQEKTLQTEELKGIQENKSDFMGKKGTFPHWIRDLEDIKSEKVRNVPTIFIGNEFLDAFPIQQYIFTQNSWRERRVTHKNGIFVFTTAKTVHTPAKTPQQGKNGGANEAMFPENPQEGDVYETSPAQENFLAKLTAMFPTLAVLLLDYAHPNGDTLQAIKNHQFVPILAEPGEADLTAHVNFERLADNLAQWQENNVGGNKSIRLISEGGLKERTSREEVSQEEARGLSAQSRGHKSMQNKERKDGKVCTEASDEAAYDTEQELEHASIMDMSTFLIQHGMAARVAHLCEQTADKKVRERLIADAERLLSPKYMGVLFKALVYRSS